MSFPSANPVRILMVEDSPDDAELMTQALLEGTLDVQISLVEDGELVLPFLRREPPHKDASRPDLILLDIHLPRRNGFEVLSDLKQAPEFLRIPIVILTALPSEEAIIKAYELYANCVVAKPVDQEEYARVVKKIEDFWLNVARRIPRT